MFEAFKLVKLAPDNAGSAPEPLSCTNWLAPLNVLPARVTVVLNLAVSRVPEDMFEAFKLVKLAPDNAGSAPDPFSCTNWLAPLNELPATVTFVDNLASSKVPLDILDALMLVRLEALSAGRYPSPFSCTSWFVPLNVFPSAVMLVDNNESSTLPLPFNCNSWLAPLNVLPARVTLADKLVS